MSDCTPHFKCKDRVGDILRADWTSHRSLKEKSADAKDGAREVQMAHFAMERSR